MAQGYTVALLLDGAQTLTDDGFCVAMLDIGSLLQEVLAESERFLAWKLECPEVKIEVRMEGGQIVPEYKIPKEVNQEKALNLVRYATRHYGSIYQQRLRDYTA